MEKIQASSVEIDGKAILLVGPPGSGKSDLCLRLMDRGARLVSDDFVELSQRSDQVIVSPPTTIEGLIEVRGIGIVKVPFVKTSPLSMIFVLDEDENIERLPNAEVKTFCGIDFPIFRISAKLASAPIKIELALRTNPKDFM